MLGARDPLSPDSYVYDWRYLIDEVIFCNILQGCKQGRSDGGIWDIYTPKSVQVNFLWDRNDVIMAIEHEY